MTASLARPLAMMLTLPLGWLAVATIADAADWNQWRGPERTGYAPDSPPLVESFGEGLLPVWRSTESMGEKLTGGWASPIVVGDRVYQYVYDRRRREDVKLPPAQYPRLSNEDEAKLSKEDAAEYEANRIAESLERQRKLNEVVDLVVCLSLDDGRELWRAEWPGRAVRWGQSSTPALVDGRLFVVGSDRSLRAFAADGNALWIAQLDPFDGPVDPDSVERPIASSPLVVDGVVIVLANRLIGFNADDGSPRWATPTDGFAGQYGSAVPLVQDGRSLAVVNVDGGQTVAVDVASGAEEWRLDTGATKSTPVVLGEGILTYSSSRRSGLRRYTPPLAAASPEPAWMYRRLADAGATPAHNGSHAFVIGDRTLAAVDLVDGQAAWTARANVSRPRYGSPIATDSRMLYQFDGLWLADSDGNLIEGRFDADARLASPETHRQRLGMDAIESGPDGFAKAEEVWQDKIERRGPLITATPALVDGYLITRLQTGLACYDLRAK